MKLLLRNASQILTAPSTDEVLPPYLAASQMALAEHEQLTEGNRVLRHGLAASAVVNVGLVTLVVFFASRPRAIPYVVAVDKTGAISAAAQAVQPATPISEDTIVRYQLAQFVRNARAILRDPAAMKEQIRLAYTLARGQAGQVLNGWYREHDPFEGARHGSVQVQIDSVLKFSPVSYEVRWTETPRDEQGTVEKATQWRGVMKVETLPPDPAEILANPLGLYVTQIDWDEEQS
jgi:type IV secretion system protein VirB5